MKRAISIILAISLIFAMTAGCGKKEIKHPISEVKVTIPCSTGERAIAEGEAVLSTQLYLLSRAYFEKLETYDMNSFNAQEYSKLLAETIEAFRIAEGLNNSFEKHANALVEMEKKEPVQQEKAKYELLSALTDSIQYSPFMMVAYAAEEKSPAVRYAEEITKVFDNAKNGQKLKTIAEKYGTDIKKAKVMLNQAQAILEGAAYEDQADFENKCYEAAVETKAAASAIGFGVAVAASGGIAAGGASVAGIMEAGGLVMNGVNAVIDLGTAVTIHATHGEGNEYTAAWEKTAEMMAPVNAVFAIGGGIQNIKDFRDPEKAKDMIDNAAQAFMVGIGFARDYVQDGTVLGVSSNIVDGYREIIVRSADTSDPEAAKEVLLKTGVSEDALKDSGSESIQDEYLGAEADTYIATMGELIDPENPIDLNAFLENLGDDVSEYASDEITDFVDVTEPDASVDISGSELAKPSDNELNGTGTLSADEVAGAYYFPELEDSAKISFSVSDDSHLMMTDVDNSESFTGDYDAETGVLNLVLSEEFRWYVTVKFTDTGNGIQAELQESLGDMSITSLGMKE